MLGSADKGSTIVAIATPPGEGGIGVVRLSGERSLAVADLLFEGKAGCRVSAQPSYTARLGRVTETMPDGSKGSVDEALVLVMRAPKSYTGEDVVEISAHGGQAVLEKIVSLALAAGARPAEPGEFTKRAFLNGRIDLVQAEAVLELIRARTERERIWAVSQLEGGLSRKMKQWKNGLVDILSHLEASVDFPDDHPDVDPAERIRERLQELSAELRAMLEDSKRIFTVRRGFSIAICGRPNVGKSSLLNRLTRTERSIVSPFPGTTRDVVEEFCSVGGFPVRFQDTAGMRDTEHPVEKEGVERSKKTMASADLVLLVLDASEALTDPDRALLTGPGARNALVVLNKSDLPSRLHPAVLGEILPNGSGQTVRSSCAQEGGTAELEKAILAKLGAGGLEVPRLALIGTIRQNDLLEKVSKDLAQALEACRQGLSPELISREVREALDHLGQLVGEVFNEDILDSLFQQFCIGK